MYSFPSPFQPSPGSLREWVCASGTGAYSSSTEIGMNTRKYHGLLVAPVKGDGRVVLLSKLEETIGVDGGAFPLSTNEYGGAVYPQGFACQKSFSFQSHPVFTYSANGAKIEKSVRMVHGKDAVVVSYRLLEGRGADISVAPMLSLRPMHADPSAEDKSFDFSSDRFGFETEKYGLRMSCSAGKFSGKPDNYRSMLYSVERERGYAFCETLFSPGVFTARLSRGEELHACASMCGLAPSDALSILDRQHLRMAHIAESCCRQWGVERTDFGDALLLAADSFVINSAGKEGVLAGFHWFSQWGRDSMIALPGILLSTGRFALAREVLLRYAARMKDGLVPNFIGEDGEASYNSADASMWFLLAVRRYCEATEDYGFVRERLWKAVREVVASHVGGKNELVAMDSDCLLFVSDPAATWMDARVGGRAVTPRKGKPVEINALWYSNLRFVAMLAAKFGERKTAEMASRCADGAAASFQKFLSSEEDGRLFDVVEPNDSALRPNQLFAVSLPDSPLNHVQKRHVFNLVRSRLYTPLGLRTLSLEDSRHHDEYSGNQERRDSAYHQGMVWPWLLGAFYDAQLEAYPGTERQVLSSLKPLAEAMAYGCVGTLPEMYEPKTMKPAGAVSQAWSVAEALRVYLKVKKAVWKSGTSSVIAGENAVWARRA